jgi:hypothetical protein
MHSFTWRDPHQPVAVHFINNRNTGMVKIVTEVGGDVQDEIELPAEAMEAFAKKVAGNKLVSLLEENDFC